MKKNLMLALALAIPAGLLAGVPGTAKLSDRMGGTDRADGPQKVTEQTDLQTMKVSQPTAFGERLLQTMKAANVPIYAPEEKIKCLKPAKVPFFVTAPEYADLEFSGSLQYNDFAGGRMELDYGFYRFGAKSNWKRSVMANLGCAFNGRGVYENHKLRGTSSIPVPYYGSFAWTYYEYDEDLWIPTGNSGRTVTANNGFVVEGADVNPLDGKVYGYMHNGSQGNMLCTIDYEHQTRSVITYTTDDIMAFAINSKGEAYAVIFDDANYEGVLYRIDLSSGAKTEVGNLGLPLFAALQSMTFDKQDRLFFAVSSVDWDTEEMIGVILHVDTETGEAKIVAYLPENEEYTVLHVLEAIGDNAPADIEDLALAFTDATTSGQVSFTIPAKTRANGALSGNVDYKITINDDEASAITGSAAAGSKVTVDVTAQKEGATKAVVVLSANGVDGKRNAVMNYAGLDSPSAKDARMSYNGASKASTVTWSTAGKFNGYVDADEVKFDVIRYPGGERVATKIKENSFSETLDHTALPYDAYYYEVVPFVGQTEYPGTKTNRIVLGKAYDVPYTESFDTNEAFYRFTVYDMNEDGVSQDQPYERVSRATWGWEPYWDKCASYRYSKENKAYDYLLTPPIHVEKDIAYNLRFRAAAVNKNYPEKLSVIVCRGDDPESDSAVTVMEETVITNGMNEATRWFELEYQSTADCDVRIAFLCTSEPCMNELFIDDISFTAGLATKAPAPAENVVVTPGRNGILEADIEFDAPALCIDGSTLESIDKIVVTRGENGPQIAELTEVQPGAHYKVTDKDAVNGRTTYCVIAHNASGAGTAATASAYIGIDSPVAPENVKLVDNLDGTATLSWEASAQGQNGGFVDTDELWFDIVTLKDGAIVKTKRDITGNSCVIEGAAKTGAANALYYGVVAVNDAGESTHALATPLMIGAPTNMPINENFKAGSFALTWLTRATDSSAQWGVYRITDFAPDNDDFCIGVEAEKKNQTAWINTSKVNLAGDGKPMLVFYSYAIKGADNVLNVYVDGNGQQNPELVCTVDGKTITEPNFEEGWVLSMVDLSQFLNCEYVVITFEAKANDAQLPMILVDDVNIRDVYDKNLAVSSTSYTRTTAGEKAEISAIVHNVGRNSLGKYRVNFHVNDKVIQTVEAEADLNPFFRKTYTCEYQTSVSDPAVSKVWTSIESADDQVESDNTSAQRNLAIYPALVNIVPNVSAEVDNQEMVNVSWDAPAAENKVVESFEGYNTFATEFGQWTLYDGDKSPTASLNGIVFPGMNGRHAFMTFDFSEAGLDLDQYPDFTGATGNQFAMAFKALNTSRNDDWLISPELNGEEQTITVYAKSLAGAYQESFEICYSTDSNEIGDFKNNVVDTKNAPTEYFGRFRFKLPAGAKYFAVHCTSTNGGLFMVDDISYQGKDLEVLSYNIYRDDELIATVPAAQTTFSEPASGMSNGQHRYNVTANYGYAQSGYSEPAFVATSGVLNVEKAGLGASGHQGYIRVNGAADKTVRVLDAQGICIYKAAGKESMTITAYPGVYIVTIADKSYKVVVK